MGAAAIEGIEWTTELKQHTFAVLFRDPIAHQELLYPDPDERRPNPLAIAEYDRWHPDNHLRVALSQLPNLARQVRFTCGGRGTGKTELTIVNDSIRRALAFRRCKVAPLIGLQKLIRIHYVEPTHRRLTQHPLLRLARATVSGFGGKETPRTEFRNESSIIWQSPGRPGSGEARSQAQQGFRATAAYPDEAQNLADVHLNTAIQQQLVSPTDPAMQELRGAAFCMSGVPDGRRDNPFYLQDTRSETFFRGTKRIGERAVDFDFRWHLPSCGMPYVTRARHDDLIRQYGCDPDNGIYPQLWRQDFWGQHGQAASVLFPAELRQSASIQVPEWLDLDVTPSAFYDETTAAGGFGPDDSLEQPSFRWLDSLLPMERTGYPYGFGIDLGAGATSSSSTVIVAFYHQAEVLRKSHKDFRLDSGDGAWVWHWCLALRGWKNSLWQTWVIHHLMERYQPRFVGMDYSTLGQGFVDNLRTHPDFRLSYGRAAEIVWGFHSTEFIAWGHTIDPAGVAIPIKQRINHFGTTNFREQLLAHSLLLPNPDQAPEVHQDLSTITMTLVSRRDGGSTMEFGPRHPHRMDALRQFTGALRQWELRATTQTAPAPRANPRDIDRLLRIDGPGLFP